MTMKFHGDLPELKKLLKRVGIIGSWERQPHDVYMLHCVDGANVHWASGTRSIWCDGKIGPRRTLEIRLASLLSARIVGDGDDGDLTDRQRGQPSLDGTASAVSQTLCACETGARRRSHARRRQW